MKKALEGITVLDFSQLLAGPFATMMLGDLGANIIKIERAEKGDLFRHLTFFNSRVGDEETPCFMAFNRNKRSLAINLKDSEAKAIIYDMVKEVDIVIENFRPGVMDKLGYGYEDLKNINPKIIYASNSGFGSSGPYVNRPGQDMLIQGLSGLMKLTGRKDAPPTPLGTGLPDQLSSFHFVYGILSALIYRERTGEGQKVEVDLLRSTLALESQEFMTILNMPIQYDRPASGIGHPFSDAPFGVYECKNGYISIAMNPFDVLVDVLGESDLMRYYDPQIRFDKRDEVFYAIESVTKTKTKEYWLEKMLDRDLWVAEVKDITEVEYDPQVKHMNAITSYEHPKAGSVKCVAPAISLSETPADITLPPPLVGQHSREILKEFGFEDKRIEKLISKGIVTEES